MVLYRKYRPQTLDELIGQEHVKKSLLTAFSAGKLAHAYLFCGPRGTGKTSTARILAKMVNCGQPSAPCNQCPTCLSITDGTNLDLIEIDAASNRGIDDIRSLRETIKLAPASAKKKVYIIDEVHMLTNEAFNALLKTLEEPPSHALFILATTEVQKIPATIASRTVRLDFNAATPSQVAEALQKVAKKEAIEIGGNLLLVLAGKAQGSFRDGVKLLDQVSSLGKLDEDTVERVLGSGKFEGISEILGKVVSQETAAGLALLIKQLESGVSPKELALGILDQLRQVLLMKNGLEEMVAAEVVGDRYKSLVKLSEKFTLERVVLAIDSFQKSLESLRFVSIPALPLQVAVVESSTNLVKSSPAPPREATPKAGEAGRVELTVPTLSRTLDKIGVQSEKGLAVTNPVMSESVQNPDIQKIQEKWPYILETIRPHNYSLEALLRSARIIECSEGKVVIEVPYSFHQRILEAPKSRDLLESVLSDVLSKTTRIYTTLGQRPARDEDLANVEVAADDEIVRLAAEVFSSETVN